jgi:serine/threonine-protein kinase
MSLSPGDVIDAKYRIVRLIGEGGMGAVYEGENVRIHRKVAIKVLHAGVAENQDAVQRFEREAQAAGRIGSDHIVEVLDLGNLPDGDRYMVMEYLDGDSLSDRIRARVRMTPSELYPISVAMLEGLKAAHGAGIIHRELKPDNVFLLRSRSRQPDFVKLLDFGISKFNQLSGESGFSMTRTGAVMGTPYYMSPEQAKGAKGMDHRADLYAVGVILYEAVTGQVPFNADTFNELLFKIVLEEPPPIQQLVPDMDPAFAAIITKAMAREPAHRFQSSEEFQNALQNWATTGASPEAVAASTGVAGAPRAALVSATGSGPQAALGTGTPGTWSSTGSYSGATPQTPPKSKTSVIVAVAVVGLLVVGGGVAAITFAGGGGAADEQAAAAAAEQEAALVAVKKAEEAARKAEEAAKRAEEEAKRKGDEFTQKATDEARRAADAARLKAEEEAKKAAELQAQLTRQAARPAPAPRPKPAEKPAEKAAPAPAPAETQTSGRKIRTEL